MAQTVDLVLEGGGVKGIGLVGAISVLEEHGMTFARVAGTSAGDRGITGCSRHGSHRAPRADGIARLHPLRDDTRLDHVPVVGKGLSLWMDHGIYAGDYFHGWVRDQLAGLGVHTFADLYRADPASSLPVDEQYKLVVMTSDVSRGRLLRLPWDYTVDDIEAGTQIVADAVRASMSIPFFFRPVILDVPKSGPSVLVDGGMLSNFPVDTFDRTDGKPPRWPTIGIKLSAQQVPNQVEHVVKGDLSLALGMLGTMQSWYDQMHLNDPAVIKRTIFIDTFGVNATDFSIDKTTQQKLFANGRAAAEKFLAAQSS